MKSLLLPLLALVFLMASCGGDEGGAGADTESASETDVSEHDGPSDGDGDDLPSSGPSDGDADSDSDGRVDPSDFQGEIPDSDTDSDSDDGTGPDGDGGTGTEPSDGEPIPPPGTLSVTSVQPSTGPISGGTAIVIRGRGFDAFDDVFIGGQAALNIDVVDEFTIFAMTPPNAAGSYAVQVARTDRSASLPDAFRYVQPTSFTAMEPAAGPETGLTPVTLRGTSFTERTVVTIGGRGGLEVRTIDEETLTFLTPPGTPGDADVRISGENGTVLAESAFRYTPVTSLEGVFPSAGSTDGGELVTITGRRMGEVSEVRFGMRSAEIVERAGTSVVVRTPASPEGAVTVRVRGPHGDAMLPDAFRYVTPSDELALVAVLPASGAVAGGDTVTLAGSFPDEVEEVRFGTRAAEVLEQGPAHVLVTTPAAAAAGTVNVRVVTADEEATLASGFRYLPTLRLDGASPGSGDVAGGTEVTLSGAGFDSTSRVRIGGLEADVLSATADTLRVRTPPGSAGLAVVEVRSGPQRVSQADIWRYTEEPEIFGMSPPRGAIAGNTFVQLYGRGLAGVEQVTVGGSIAPLFEERDATLLTFRTPPGAVGAAPVVVDVAGADVSPADPFFYFNPFIPGGGWWGESILGAVNVTVFDGETGQPIEDAFVTLSIRADESTFTAVTNANGQATVSGEGVRGGQSVHIVAENYSAVTVQDVNAENIIVYLFYICTDPDDPRCDGDGEPPPIPQGTIQGTLTGLDKIADPGPGRSLMAVVYPTFGMPWNRLTDPLPFGPPANFHPNALAADGPFSYATRVGEQAALGFCGVWDANSERFEPRYMGVARGLFVADGSVVTADIDCSIRLTETLSVKLLDSPAASDARLRNHVVPYLDFGSEGVFGGLWTATGAREEFSVGPMPPLAGDLGDVTLTVAGGALPAAGLPFSYTVAREIRNMSALLTLPPLVAPAVLVRPTPFSGVVEGRRIEWRPNGTSQPDLWYAYIMDQFQENLLWEMWVPGDQPFLNLPYWPAEAPGTPLQPGDNFVLIIYAIDMVTFDFDAFQNQDFAINNWRSWGVNGWFLTWQ